MRLFIAIPIPDDLTPGLETVAAALPSGRALPPENLHLTLAFLGDIPDRQAEDVHDALGTVASPPVRIEATGIDALGHPSPKVIAATVRPDPALLELRRKIRAALHGQGIMPDREHFRPHITIARLNGRLTPDEQARLAAFLAARGSVRPVAFTARQFALYASTLHPGGAVHELLAEYPLG